MSDHYEPEMADPGEGDMFGAFAAVVCRKTGHEWDRVYGRRQCRKCGRWHGADPHLDDPTTERAFDENRDAQR